VLKRWFRRLAVEVHGEVRHGRRGREVRARAENDLHVRDLLQRAQRGLDERDEAGLFAVALDGHTHGLARARRELAVQAPDGAEERCPVQSLQPLTLRMLQEDGQACQRRGRDGVDQRGERAENGGVIPCPPMVDAHGKGP
jgi:hypothetical protein